jgi:hypothetical protein
MRTDSERLADILDAVQRIRRHVKVDDRHRFQQDEVLQNAVLRSTSMSSGTRSGTTCQRLKMPSLAGCTLTSTRRRAIEPTYLLGAVSRLACLDVG